MQSFSSKNQIGPRYSVNKNRFILTFLFLTLILSACGSQQISPTKSDETIQPAAIATALLKPTSIPSATFKAITQPAITPMPISISPTSFPNPTKSGVTPQDWQYRWLKGIPCRPPCFEGIMPGRTTVEEALNLLRNNPLVSDVTTQSTGNYGSVVWNWIYQRKNTIANLYNAEALYDLKATNPTIVFIEPLFQSAPSKLDDVIKAYGEPSHVIAGARLDYDHISENYLYDLTIVFLSQGFAISTYDVNALKKRPVLDANLALDHLGFFTPDKVEAVSFLVVVNTNTKFLIPWQGYKSFEFYCLALNPQNDKCQKNK